MWTQALIKGVQMVMYGNTPLTQSAKEMGISHITLKKIYYLLSRSLQKGNFKD